MNENRSKPDQYQLRFPPGMRDRLKSAADRNGRSMNAEIVARLEESWSPRSDSEDNALARAEAANMALRSNFEILANQLAGPVGENREEVIRVLSALRVLGQKVPE